MTYSFVGLFLDIIGVLLLFRYGVLPKRMFESLLRDNTFSDKTVETHHKLSNLGVFLLVLGFVFQGYGLYLQSKNGL